jgi:hypothetical protein
MTEYEPFDGRKEMEPTKAPVKGPNVICTLDTPPHPDAVKMHDAAIRKHLKDRRPSQNPPDAV